MLIFFKKAFVKDAVWYYLHLQYLVKCTKNSCCLCRFIYGIIYFQPKVVRANAQRINAQIAEEDDDYFTSVNNVINRVGTRVRNPRNLRILQ